jgi:DNA-binding Lrp family transcriptional regulator
MTIDKDQQLLNLLKRNARTSVSELARTMGVSRTTVQQRIQRLEARQIIDGYTVRMGIAAQRSRIQAHTNIVIEPNANKTIVDTLEKIPVIETLYTVSGKIDLIAIINVSSASELDQQLDRISAIPGIKSTETAIVLTTKFDRR